ncbi:MAG: hypothetical protein ACE5FM_02385, partial [Methyloligellaceae bacterium]
MSFSDPTGTDWTTKEIDLIVADYFEMLKMELSGVPYVKAHRNSALQKLTGRSKGSIEFKHQNVSAVLIKLGMPWISGYKPMANYQNTLINGIEQYLIQHEAASLVPLTENAEGFFEESSLIFESLPERVAEETP